MAPEQTNQALYCQRPFKYMSQQQADLMDLCLYADHNNYSRSDRQIAFVL